jgi:hypothetical protein
VASTRPSGGTCPEVDDLGYLELCLLDAGDVGEGRSLRRRLVPPRLRAPQSAEPAARHPSEEPDHHRHEQDGRSEADEQGRDERPLRRRLGVDHDVLLEQQARQLVVRDRRPRGRKVRQDLSRQWMLEAALERVAHRADRLDIAVDELLAEDAVRHADPFLGLPDVCGEVPVEDEQGEDEQPAATPTDHAT